jgi:5-methylcytosine-specific restriction endonuclease McrA
MRRRSLKKRREHERERLPLLQSLFADGHWCERCGLSAATDAHEIVSRARGGSTTDPANIALLCRACHNWITTHPGGATDEGWLL